MWSTAVRRSARGAPALDTLLSEPRSERKRHADVRHAWQFYLQGIQHVKDTIKRADAFKSAAKKAGCTVKEIYWTQGQFDNVMIMDAPDDASMTALLMSLGKLGNVRTQLCAPSRRPNLRQSWTR